MIGREGKRERNDDKRLEEIEKRVIEIFDWKINGNCRRKTEEDREEQIKKKNDREKER